MKREHTFMSDEVWGTILSHYILPFRHINAFTPPTFIPHKDGETLLNKKLLDRIGDVSRVASDMTIDIYSNGVLLPKWRDRGQDVFEFLGKIPNRVRYLMSYHPRNRDWSENDYSQVVPYLKEVLRNPPPNVEFITVSHRSKWVTPEMQEGWRKEWEGLPITVHCNCAINPWTGRMEDIATCKYNGCPYADFGHLFIGVTGNIIACCLDLEEEIVLGNVMVDEPAAMFAATEAFYAEQRRILAAKERHPRGVCSNCFGQDRAELVQLGVA
jgi:hypothetical protein